MDRVIQEHYWVMFVKSDTFWQKFFYGTYRHISLLKNDGFNWMLIDPRSNSLLVDILPFEGDAEIKEVVAYFKIDMKAIRVFASSKGEIFKIRKALLPRFFNCVRVIKYVLGMKASGFFPSSFHDELMRMGKSDQSNSNIVVDIKSIYEHRSK